MSYKIVVDSSCEIPKEYLERAEFEVIPFGLEVGEDYIVDDETFDQKIFLDKVAKCPTCPKSACPSPEKFFEAFKSEVDHIYVVTISSKLSGCYNSAMLGVELYKEQFGEKNIHVIDSKSASCGETQIALKLIDLEEEGKDFTSIVKNIEIFRDEMSTYFILDNLETLRKNGRMSGVKAMVASTLSIKPLMGAKDGEIVQRGQSIGMKKTMAKLAELLITELVDGEAKRLMISHCNAPERAENMKKIIESKTNFKEVIIVDMRGLSSLYANNGGIIVVV